MDKNDIEESVVKDTGLYKSRLISTILSDKDACEVLLKKKDYTDDDVDNLIYKQVFPYLYVDDTQTEVLTYICLEVDIPRMPSHTVKSMQVTIWVYSHKDDMRYSRKGFSGTKVDILSDIVERALHNSDKFGIGKLVLSSVNHFLPNTKYYGRQLIFNTSDFKVKKVN